MTTTLVASSASVYSLMYDCVESKLTIEEAKRSSLLIAVALSPSVFLYGVQSRGIGTSGQLSGAGGSVPGAYGA